MALAHRETESHVAEWPMLGWPERWRRMFEADGGEQWLRVEEFHEGDTLVVKAELPGIDPDKDVEVTTSGGVVKIRAHREEKAEQKGKRGYRTEFRYGEFERDVALPEGADSKDVKATYKDGILEVRVPCPAAKKKEEPMTIPVVHS